MRAESTRVQEVEATRSSTAVVRFLPRMATAGTVGVKVSVNGGASSGTRVSLECRRELYLRCASVTRASLSLLGAKPDRLLRRSPRDSLSGRSGVDKANADAHDE